jgi:hypothetical protein
MLQGDRTEEGGGAIRETFFLVRKRHYRRYLPMRINLPTYVNASTTSSTGAASTDSVPVKVSKKDRALLKRVRRKKDRATDRVQSMERQLAWGCVSLKMLLKSDKGISKEELGAFIAACEKSLPTPTPELDDRVNELQFRLGQLESVRAGMEQASESEFAIQQQWIRLHAICGQVIAKYAPYEPDLLWQPGKF